MSVANLGIMSVPVCLTLSLMLCSCSVKENRDGCPCRLHLAVDEFIRAGFRNAVVIFDAGDSSVRDELELVRYSGRPYEITLPRSMARLSVVAGAEEFMLEDNILSVPYGQEAGPLWLFHEVVACSGDEEYVSAVPLKQYCCLTVVVDGMGENLEYDCSMAVRAACNGVCIFDAGPVGGNYHASARRTARNTFSVRIPRQSGNGLLLDIFPEGSGHGKAGGAPAPWTVDLGQKLADSGYDWTKESLDDVSAVIDCSRAEVTVSVQEWESDDSFGNMEI